MKKINLDKNVYEALLERLRFIFQEFENIYISFSGEKDSGLLLNILLDFQYYPSQIIGVFHQDFEAQYNAMTDYIKETFRCWKSVSISNFTGSVSLWGKTHYFEEIEAVDRIDCIVQIGRLHTGMGAW